MLKDIEVEAESASFWKKLGKVKLGLKQRANNPRCNSKDAQHRHTDDCYNFFPKDVNYFVLDKKWHKALGEQPQELAIMLAFPTWQQTFDIRRAWYKQNGSKACFTLDGITAKRMVSDGPKPDGKGRGGMIDTFKQIELPCPGDGCEYASKCPKRGQLEFMIPDCGEVGTFFMKTGSMISAKQMLAVLKALTNFTQGRANGLHGLRLVLRRELMVFNPDIKKDGNLVRIEKYIPKLEIDFKSLMAKDHDLLGPLVGKNIALQAPASAEELGHDDEDEDEEPPQGAKPTSFAVGA